MKTLSIKTHFSITHREAGLLSPLKWRTSFSLFCLFLILSGDVSQAAESKPGGWTQPVVTEIASGIWRVRFGTPERFTPDSIRERQPDIAGIARLPMSAALPFKPEDISCRVTGVRTVVYVPCDEPESQIYGFGLDAGAYGQKGLRKWLGVCATVMGKTGASHAPMPFWLSTKGYGVYVDTAHATTVHVARLSPKEKTEGASQRTGVMTSTADLYAARKAVGKTSVVVEIPGNTTGVDVYVFAGPTMREVVARYNLFSGGGCMPPMWGLGMRYRNFTRADQTAVMNVAKAIRAMRIPCDGLGLEPGWQSASYSCSLAWSEKFPTHDEMITSLNDMGFRVNLWEHAYIHSSSPIYKSLKEHSGDNLVWGGLVVDFADPVAFKLFSDYHGATFIDRGVSGFKADECDNQPITDCTPFNFPSSSEFPSGIDGEQMVQLYGAYYQRSISAAFTQRNLRTWGEVRASTALAAPLPFTLYSDAYEFDHYLRQLLNASFTGLMWSPEVREAGSYEELLNRIALSSFAPQMCLDMWFMPHPIWEQYRQADSEADKLLPPDEQQRIADRLRDIVSLRYRLLPYLYAAFHRYRTEGLPPVRSLLLDFPDDSALRTVEDQFMFGDSLLVAPFNIKNSTRKIYLPKNCNWIELKSNSLFEGGQTITVNGQPGDVPLFIRENSLLPWAEPVEHVGRDTVFELTVKVFGDNPTPFTLVEDDGETTDFERGMQNLITLSWEKDNGAVAKKGNFPGSRYRMNRWEKIALSQVTQWKPIQSGSTEARSKGLLNGDFSANALDFSVANATGYISQCKPIVGWTASDPNRIGLQPLQNGFANMGPKSIAGVAYFAFLQESGRQISQQLNLSPGVKYALSFQVAARNYSDDTSPAEQVLKVSVVGGNTPVVSKELIASKSGFEGITIEFTAPKEPAILIFKNASAAGETCVVVSGIAVKALEPPRK